MGAVYVVDQLSTGAQRALKLMLPELVADEKLRLRFEQEARIGARIESDHVVQVVAAGLDASTRTPWLAMELLRGMNLGDYVAQNGPVSAPVLLAMFGQLCHAVGAAHTVGVVHRDLKPENIFLADGRRSGLPFMVKVLDFGIAKIAAEAKTTETAAIGTPAWMAPEQTSRGRPVGPQTDVWALGLIAFWMLTGRSYWRSANDDVSTMAMLLREMLLDEIEPASSRAQQYGVQVGTEFDAWFARCVHREVRARFATATHAYSELARAVSLSDVSSRPALPPPRGLLGETQTAADLHGTHRARG